jgi:molybdopterin molybdotransferase
MLSYDEALLRVLAAIASPLPVESIPLADAYGRPLAEAVTARESLPSFDNSAVDGFAVHHADTLSATPVAPVLLPVSLHIRAGDAPDTPLAPGTAARIFTGAPLPPDADAIIMQEDTRQEEADGTVALYEPASPAFIRRQGSDITAGAVALPAGSVLDAGSIGLLAALNVTQVHCARRPRVALLTTGDEILPPSDAPLPLGKIRDSNGPALCAAIEEAGATVASNHHAADDATSVRDALLSAAEHSDVIIASGGVSVGDYDHVKTAASELGELDFWRIAIKPGKPLAFGRIGNALFFGLPGNPVSSLVTFELFVRPVLRKLAGYADVTRPQVSAILTAALPHEPGRREFVRARLHWQNDTYYATPLGAQGSHRLASVAGAQALLMAHEDHGDYEAGSRLPALLLTD